MSRVSLIDETGGKQKRTEGVTVRLPENVAYYFELMNATSAWISVSLKSGSAFWYQTCSSGSFRRMNRTSAWEE
jgi:hypothetical protein